jgi:GNAT superfamily N-acetyltransferase
MSTYRVRPATLDDADALVHHRIGMFTDMGTKIDEGEVESAFRRWLAETMPAGVYRAWVVEDGEEIVGGGGITVLPWPPGPQFVGGRIAFVYNVYTEHAHRRRGIAQLVMNTIHGWCRDQGIRVVGLNASRDGQPLYEKLGYASAESPMMFVGLDDVAKSDT